MSIQRVLMAGLLATLLMDLGSHVLYLAGAFRGPVNPAILGRWFGHFTRGKFRHENIASSPVLADEVTYGFLGHYLIGVVLAFTYALALRAIPLENSPAAGLGYGFLTNAFPWFLSFPCFGYGVLGLKAERLLLSSTINHLVYGFGLYWALI